MPRPLRVSEELTRKEMIDRQLETAGWYLHADASIFDKASKGEL